MQGKMDDDAGKVWTYLANEKGWRNFTEISWALHCVTLKNIGNAIGFWLDNGELEVRQRRGFPEYRIAKKEPGK